LAAARASDSAHARIQRLALELRNRDAEATTLRARLDADDAQVDILRELDAQTRRRHDRLHIDVAVQVAPAVVDRAQNTDSEPRAPGGNSSSDVRPFEDSASLGAAEEVDDGTTSLILMLNKRL
jgi:hypothetical protein